MGEWEVTTPLGITGAKGNASSSDVNSDCQKLECYMVLSKEEQTAIGSICFLAGPITLLENALVLWVIAATATLRKRPSYLFIGNLALADVFASCFFTISFLDFHLFHHDDGPIAYLFKCPTVLAPPCSRLFPYINQGYLACWTSFILVLLALILGAYALILLKAHKHESSMTNLQGAAGTGQARMRMDIRLARTFGLILLILVGCWLPALSFMLADVSVVLTHTQQRAFAFCSTLCLVNSAVNPLLYALRCRELRVALLQLLQDLRKNGRCKKSTGDFTPGPPSGEDDCTTFSDDEMPPARPTQLNSVSEIVKKQQLNIRT
eukprot:superscaffoldBa00000157_g2241